MDIPYLLSRLEAPYWTSNNAWTTAVTPSRSFQSLLLSFCNIGSAPASLALDLENVIV
jgi:hypothetical protein